MRVLVPLALLLALAGGCTSAKEVYHDGMAFETAGDYPAAAAAYARALERDRSLPNVAGRLRVAGREAVRGYVARAATADAEGAAQAYLDADALLDRARAVGVELERPASFQADRDAAFDDAIDALFYEADARLAAGDFADALRRTAEAQRFRPSAEQAAALADLALDTHLAWAHADLAAGRYRQALERTEAGAALDPASDRGRAFDDLRLDIWDAGRVVAAVLPVERGADVPERFRRDLFDVLVEDRLAETDPFVDLVDPAEVRRWDRRRRSAVALSDSPRRLAEAAADLGADVGAVVALGPIAEQEVVGDAQARTARVEGSAARVGYTVREVTLTLSVRADVVAADAASRAAVCDRPVRERASVTYEAATTDGDWRRLELSRSERAAFGPDRAADAREDALDRLRDRLASALAEELQRCLGARVR